MTVTKVIVEDGRGICIVNTPCKPTPKEQAASEIRATLGNHCVIQFDACGAMLVTAYGGVR